MEFTKQPRVLLAQARKGLCTEESGGNEVTQSLSQGSEKSKKKKNSTNFIKMCLSGSREGGQCPITLI